MTSVVESSASLTSETSVNLRTGLRSAPIPVSLFIFTSGIEVNPCPVHSISTPTILPPSTFNLPHASFFPSPISTVSVEL